jgi:hypothetical protein
MQVIQRDYCKNPPELESNEAFASLIDLLFNKKTSSVYFFCQKYLSLIDFPLSLVFTINSYFIHRALNRMANRNARSRWHSHVSS